MPEIDKPHMSKTWINFVPCTLDDKICDELIELHNSLPYADINIDGVKILPTDPQYQDNLKSYKYQWPHDGNREHTMIYGDELVRVEEIIEDIKPDHRDYFRISFCQIIRYRTGGFFHPHKDNADQDDSATAIITLNDNYDGGRFVVEPGVTIKAPSGSMIAFNNSTELWHMVEPIYAGERWVLAVWFQRYQK